MSKTVGVEAASAGGIVSSMFEIRGPDPTWSSRLDRIISTLSPAWGARRAAFRHAQHEVESLSGSGFRGARHTRTDRKKATQGRADRHLETHFDRRNMVDRARQLERNSVLAEGILSRSVENVVGCGFKLQAMSASPTWNAKVEELWSFWGDNLADVRRMATWDELLALKFRSYLRDGDVGTILLSDGSIQTFESDQLSSPNSRILSREMVDGIRLDKRGRPISFFIVDRPDPINASVRFQKHTEIPAKSVLFLPRRTRLGQTRGMSCFNTIAWLLDQVDGNIEAVTVAARMAASFGLLITAPNPTGLPPITAGDGRSYPKIAMEPGMAKYLRPGQDVTQIKPEQPTQNFSEFLRMLGRFIGMALGLPLEIAFGDYSKTNFTSGRMAFLSAWRTWRCYQKMLKRYSTQVYNWKLLEWMSTGVLEVREDALKHMWHPPTWQFIDPVKEINAALAAVDGGLKTRAMVSTELMQVDFISMLEARALEIKAEEKAGIVPSKSTLTRDPTDTPAPIDEDPDDDDDEDNEDEEGSSHEDGSDHEDDPDEEDDE